MEKKSKTKKLPCKKCDKDVQAVEKDGYGFVCPFCLSTLDADDA